MPSFPKLEGDIKTDVLVVGGGMAGLLTAFLLEKNGINCVLIEAKTIGSGISGNTTAKITSQHGLIYSKLSDFNGSEYARLYWQANEEAIEKYRSLCAEIPCDFEDKSSYVYSANNNNLLMREIDTLNNLGIPVSYVTDISLPFDVSGAVRFENQAQFNPMKFISGIARNLNIYEHTSACGFSDKTVVTENGSIMADKIIIATHFPIINKHGGFFLKMYQSRSYVVALENAQNVDGMYVDEAESGFSFRNYGDLLLLGGGSHRTGKQGSGWESLEAAAEKYYPESKVKYRWAAQDCMTLDGSAYIGRYGKNTPDLFVATGFNKWGMTLSMCAATLLCDIVLGRKNPYEALFSPSRKLYVPQLTKNICESAANIFTFSKPRCPHLGCALKWNRYEHSWDCPCHGSRFSQNGTLLDNPATDDADLG